jgi:hypothetical protein
MRWFALALLALAAAVASRLYFRRLGRRWCAALDGFFDRLESRQDCRRQFRQLRDGGHSGNGRPK